MQLPNTTLCVMCMCVCVMYLIFNYDTRFYIGHTPVLVVANPEMVKEITIKQSANFMDRSVCAVMHTFCTHAVT